MPERGRRAADCLLAVALLLLATPAGGGVAEVGVPKLTNFDPKSFDSNIGYQNWAAMEDRRGVMYIGNTSGLVEYDGVTWRLLPLPGRGTARSLAMDEEGRIFVGGQGSFGMLAADPLGQIRFQSLSDRLPVEARNFTDVWKTHVAPEGVYFQTFSHLFRWREGGIRIWKPETSFHMSFLVDGTLYVRHDGVGLMTMSGDALQLVAGGERFAEIRIYAMVGLGDGLVLVGTREMGFFLYDGESFERFTTEADDYIASAQLYHGTLLGDGSIALATLRGGVVLIDRHGSLQLILDRSLGLQDSTVTSVHADTRGGLWLTLDRNISRVEIPSAITVFGELTGLKGAVNSVERFKGGLFAATTQGVYRLEKAKSGATVSSFGAVPGIATQSWGLAAFDDILLGATNEGVFAVRNGRSDRVFPVRALALLRSRFDRNRVFVGMLDGVRSLLWRDGSWLDDGPVGHFEDEVRTLAEDDQGGLWIGGRYRGVRRLTRSAADDGWQERSIGELEGLPSGLRRGRVYRSAGKILVASSSGLFQLDDHELRFSPSVLFGEVLGRRETWITAVREGGNGHVWIVSGPESGLGVARPQEHGSYQWDNRAFRGIEASSVLEIFPEADGVLWVGTSNGLIRYDPEVPAAAPAELHGLIRRVTSLDDDRPVFCGTHPQGETRILELPFERNGLRFEFAAPFPGSQRGVEYRHTLDGFDSGWSEWSREVRREYTNLPEGDYSFNVMARASGGVVGSTDRFVFQVLPPWHRTWWAATTFMLLAVATLWAFVQLQVRHARRKERREAENRRRAFELQRARRIQRNMLPSEPPEVPGLEIAAMQLNATEVGGDYYDFFPQDDGSVFAAIGDATGHGLGAGLMVAATRTALLTVREVNLVTVARKLNSVLRRVHLGNRLNMALTLASIRTRPAGGGMHVELTGGGMAPAYVLRADAQAEEHLISGIPLGALPEPEYRLVELHLAANELLVLMSDGVHERWHAIRGPLGYDGVLSSLRDFAVQHAGGPCITAQQVLDHVIACGDDWAEGAPIEDDVTVVVIRAVEPTQA